ncbi:MULTISPECIES: helix-turn-helix transcriptional regulator [unclassified Streptomyces]|uniref:helix-turn-helix transcriptional regulator n=1 Tax=Streptomyces sp. NBC_01298 TaxID=2903817 RepID=UPI002E14D569|nr:DNA-binding protein [Streptomyces sp. NBC_01298]
MAEELLSPVQVEARYGLARQRLANWRWMGTGPAYIKTSSSKSGRIVYRGSAIEAWLDAQTVPAGSAA